MKGFVISLYSVGELRDQLGELEQVVVVLPGLLLPARNLPLKLSWQRRLSRASWGSCCCELRHTPYFNQNHLPFKPSYFVIFILSYFYTSPAVVIENTSYIILLHTFINGKLTQWERWRPWDNMIANCKLLFHFHLFTRWTAKTQASQEPRAPWLGNWRSKG